MFDRSVLETLQTLHVKGVIVPIKHSHFLERQRWAFIAEMKGSAATGGNSLPAFSLCVFPQCLCLASSSQQSKALHRPVGCLASCAQPG